MNFDLLETQNALKSDNLRLKAVNEQLQTAKTQQIAEVESLRAEVNRLRNEVEAYEDEQKQYQMQIAELEGKVKELESRNLNFSEFMKWNSKQIVSWITSLEKGRFQKYEEILNGALSADDVIGEDLLDVTALTLKAWGIKDRKDAKGVNGHIESLVKQYGPHGAAVVDVAAAAAPKENEGAPTAFVG